MKECMEEVLNKFDMYLNEDTCLDEYHQDQVPK